MAPAKVTKSPTKAKNPEAGKLDKNLAFLWVCFEHKTGQVSKSMVDYDAVSRELGITAAAAQKRISRLRNLVKKQGLLDQGPSSQKGGIEETEVDEAEKEDT
ncbi:uncharacterized protein N7459_002843 [Penicillium hispanicum]|uniref:uncharacterized protein n=1 Tax=Penicillium hispanicum TaxID=1080232 RepID=UPI0025406BF4|nr:uncharacterized protein N7459_002843 [Penicillium hispanicum]KAJ5587078.1 hypothetical protein N7459_002843 [Penicillium hispanicum]